MKRTHLAAAWLLGSALVLLGAPARAQECLDCHGQPGSSVSFKDGSSKDITIDPDAWAASVHGAMGASCTDCHTEHAEYPHPELKAGSAREYTLSHYNSCEQCHEEQFKKQLDGVHMKLIAAGNKNAAVCSDCHNPHSQQKITGEDGKLLPQGRLAVPQTCARCHAEIQAKYKLSPQVLRTYVADFHGSTVTLFERRHPDQVTNKPVCYDCHGIHDIASKSDPKKSLQVKANLLQTCQKCHPDATANFSDAWLSHYIPTKDRTPLVYWSRLAYQILIPGVVGGMALFVASDFLRRRLDRRRHLERRHRGEIA